jgi:hypothetical protein
VIDTVSARSAAFLPELQNTLQLPKLLSRTVLRCRLNRHAERGLHTPGEAYCTPNPCQEGGTAAAVWYQLATDAMHYPPQLLLLTQYV